MGEIRQRSRWSAKVLKSVAIVSAVIGGLLATAGYFQKDDGPKYGCYIIAGFVFISGEGLAIIGCAMRKAESDSRGSASFRRIIIER